MDFQTFASILPLLSHCSWYKWDRAPDFKVCVLKCASINTKIKQTNPNYYEFGPYSTPLFWNTVFCWCFSDVMQFEFLFWKHAISLSVFDLNWCTWKSLHTPVLTVMSTSVWYLPDYCWPQNQQKKVRQEGDLGLSLQPGRPRPWCVSRILRCFLQLLVLDQNQSSWFDCPNWCRTPVTAVSFFSSYSPPLNIVPLPSISQSWFSLQILFS